MCRPAWECLLHHLDHGVQNAAIDMLCGGRNSSVTAAMSRRVQPALAGRVGSGRKRKLAVQPKSDTGNTCRLDRFLSELYAVGKLLRSKREGGAILHFPFVYYVLSSVVNCAFTMICALADSEGGTSDGARPPLAFDPESVVEQSGLTPSACAAFVHHNCLDTFTQIEELTEVCTHSEREISVAVNLCGQM